MNPYFQIKNLPKKRLLVKVAGRSTVLAAKEQFMQVEREFIREKCNEIEFDLKDVDPINNIAGRYWDLACHYKEKGIKRVTISIPRNVLEQIDPAIDAVKGEFTVRGILLRITADAIECSGNSKIIERSANFSPDNKILISCMGKVRHVGETSVTVSLFHENDEIIGEIGSAQFPDQKFSVGTVFAYNASVVVPGKTEVFIEYVLPQSLGTNEFIEIWNKANEQVADGDY